MMRNIKVLEQELAACLGMQDLTSIAYGKSTARDHAIGIRSLKKTVNLLSPVIVNTV